MRLFECKTALFVILFIAELGAGAQAPYSCSEFLQPSKKWRPIPLWFWNNTKKAAYLHRRAAPQLKMKQNQHVYMSWRDNVTARHMIFMKSRPSVKMGVFSCYNRNNDAFLSNARLFYHGSIEQAADALSSQLENMVGIASHILADYIPDNTDYYSAPNFSEALRAELGEEVTQAAQVTAGQQTYDLICRMSQTFMDIYKTKDAYIRMMAAGELAYDAVCSIGTYEDIVNFENTYYSPINDAFLEGTFSADEANKITDELLQSNFYLQTYGEEPELAEGEYVCSTPYHLVWISNQVNSDRNRGLHFALANDIDMSEIVNFSPIGTYIDGGKQNTFNGQFDGRCHVIRNLNIVVGDETVEQTATSIKGIYTITGMKVLDEPQNLKRGLYIIDGRKVLIR